MNKETTTKIYAEVKASSKLYLLVFVMAAFIVGIGMFGMKEMKIMNQNIQTIYADRVFPLQQLTTVRDAYISDILLSVHQVKTHHLSFVQAEAQVLAAQVAITDNWNKYKLTYLTPEEKELAQQSSVLMNRATATVEKLKKILQQEDDRALNTSIDQELYADINPVIKKISELVNLQVRVSGEVYKSNVEDYNTAKKKFTLLILLSLLFAVPFSYYLVRNVNGLIADLHGSNLKIKERESQVSAFFENIEGAAAMLDAEKKYVLFNKRFIYDHKLLTKQEPYAGQLVYDLFPEEIQKPRLKLLDNVLKGNNEFVEVDYVRDGKRVCYRTSFIPVITDGKVTGISTYSIDLTKSKEAEMKIRESEEKFRMAFMTSQDAFYIGTLNDGKIVDVNEGFLNLFGYSRGEVIGKSSLELNIYSNEDDRTKLFEGLKAKGRVKDLEFVMRRKNGDAVIVSISANTSEMNNEKIILAVIRDITERKNAEALIKEQAETFSAIIENANESIWLLSPDLKVLQFNKTAKDRILLNRGKEIYIGADFKEFLHGGTDNVFMSMFNDALADKYPEHVTSQTDINGEVFWLRTRMYPVYNTQKGLIGITVLTENITARKKIEKELEQSEEKNRALIENISDTIVLVNEKLEIIYQSPSFIRTAGFTLDDHKGKTIMWVMHPDEIDECLAILHQSKESPGAAIPFQLCTLHKKGHYIWVEGTVTNLLQNESVNAFVLNYRDITERKNAEAKLENTLLELEIRVAERTKELFEKNKSITDSIVYAKRIQQAKLPSKEIIYSALPDSFVLFKPKDIVSGDFYFFHKNDKSVFIASADCTGHGVPGAFMSMIGSEKLDDALAHSADTSEILSHLNKGIKVSLHQTDSNESTRDGMDIALCSVDTNTRVVKYAGANRPIWIIREGHTQIEEIKGTKTAIGGLTDDSQHFDTHKIKLNQGDSFYIFSDGYADSFGGKEGKKLTTKKFKQILLSIQDKSMRDQEVHLDNFIENWKNGTEQVDDILVIGVRL